MRSVLACARRLATGGAGACGVACAVLAGARESAGKAAQRAAGGCVGTRAQASYSPAEGGLAAAGRDHGARHDCCSRGGRDTSQPHLDSSRGAAPGPPPPRRGARRPGPRLHLQGVRGWGCEVGVGVVKPAQRGVCCCCVRATRERALLVLHCSDWRVERVGLGRPRCGGAVALERGAMATAGRRPSGRAGVKLTCSDVAGPRGRGRIQRVAAGSRCRRRHRAGAGACAATCAAYVAGAARRCLWERGRGGE